MLPIFQNQFYRISNTFIAGVIINNATSENVTLKNRTVKMKMHLRK